MTEPELTIDNFARHGRIMQLVLRTLSSGVVALDRAGTVVLANQSARHMLGGVSQEAPFDWPKIIQFLDAESMTPLDGSADPVARSLAGLALRSETHVMTRRNSAVHRYVRVSNAIVDDASSDVYVVLILDDVTSEERHRQQIERAGRLDALGQLTGGIAHDFNNYLATIQAGLDLAQMRTEQDDVKEVLAMAGNAVQRGAELTGRLLSFGKRQPALATSFAVNDAIKNVCAMATPTVAPTVELAIDIQDEDAFVFCDQGQLENALLNLVLNARDALSTKDGSGRVDIRVRNIETLEIEPAAVAALAEAPQIYKGPGARQRTEEDRLRADGRYFRYVDIAVADNGCGMSDEVKSRAIDPFFSTKTERASGGLGLSMVYGFVQQSAGELRIYSEIGNGTTVRMLLPRGAPQGKREEPVSSGELQRGHGQVILVAEDEASLLTAMCTNLEALGYRTIEATTGAQALDHVLGDEAIDLLLSDIVMPGGMSGFSLAQEVRKARPDLPVIYMSGYTGYSAEQTGDVQAPMIEKPCSIFELAAILNQELMKAS